MAGGRGDITAGRAFVELFVKKGAFVAGLADAQARLRAFGDGLRTVGLGIAGAGAAIVAPLLASLKHFEAAGSALNDMAARTGASVEALGQLSYAADQTGASIEDVEKAIVKLHRTMAAARAGSMDARKAFQELGLDWRQLGTMSPDEQFTAVAAAIGKIENPARRSALAIETLGKSSVALLPMLSDLEALRKEAEELGAMTTAEAKAADDFGDALGRLRTIASNTANVIGSSLAPAATEFLAGALDIAKEVLAWARANEEAVKTVAAVGLTLAGVGVLFAVQGGAISAVLDVAKAGIATFATLGGVLGLLANPVVLIGGALLGVAYGLYRAGVGADTTGKAIQWAGGQMTAFAKHSASVLDALSSDFGDTWRGIVDAVAGGDLQLAADVALAGLNLMWTRAANEADKAWSDAVWYFETVWNEATAMVASVFVEWLANLKDSWSELAHWMTQALSDVFYQPGMQQFLGSIAVIVNDLKYLAGLIDETERKGREVAIEAMVYSNSRGEKRDEGTRRAESQRMKERSQIEQERIGALQAIDDQKAAARRRTDEDGTAAIKNREEALKKAREELDLKRRAAAGQAEAARQLRQQFQGPPEEQRQPGISGRTVGAFSASSLFALGGGTTGPQNVARQQLRALEHMDDNIEKIERLQRAQQQEAYA